MNILRASAIIVTALALVPGGAHVFELPNKLALPEQQYFVVQQIYRGWGLFGGVIFVAPCAAAFTRTGSDHPLDAQRRDL